MGDCQARFCERLGGEIPPCLLDVCPAMNQGTFKYTKLSASQGVRSLKLIHHNFR